MSKRRDKNILTFLILAAVFLMFISTNMVQSQTGNPALKITSNPISEVKFTIDGEEYVTPWSGEITIGTHTFDTPLVQTINGADYVFLYWVSSRFEPTPSVAFLPLTVNITDDTSIKMNLKVKVPDKPRKFGYITWGTEITKIGGLHNLLPHIEASKFQVLVFADGGVFKRGWLQANINFIRGIADFCDTHRIDFWITIGHNMSNPNEAVELDSALSQINPSIHPSISRYLLFTEWMDWNKDYNLNRQAYLDLKSVVNAHGISHFGEWLYISKEQYGTTQEEGLTWLNAQKMTFLWHNRLFGNEGGWGWEHRNYWVPTWIDDLGIEDTCGITLGVWENPYFINPTAIIRSIETMLTTEKAEHIMFLGNGVQNYPPLPTENIETYSSLYDRYSNVFIKEQPITTTNPTVISTTITTVISPTTTITTVIPPTTTTITTVDSPITTYTTVIPQKTTIITTVISPTSSKNPLSFIEINDLEIPLILAADVFIPILLYIIFIRRKRHE